jgi:hypothetical protein
MDGEGGIKSALARDHKEPMNKSEACELLGISTKTLGRRMASGRYTFTRTGEGQYAAISFTHSDLGLPEPSVGESPTEPPAGDSPARDPLSDHDNRPEPCGSSLLPQPEPACPGHTRPATQEELDLEFAAKYKAGLVEDSYGNRIGDPKPLTALGPMEPKPKKKRDNTAHMDPALIGTAHVAIGTDGEPIAHAGSDNHPLVALGRKDAPAPKQHDSNQTRQKYLGAIWLSVRNGYSR